MPKEIFSYTQNPETGHKYYQSEPNPENVFGAGTHGDEGEIVPLVEQVLWELNNLDDADVIVAYIDPKTLSPITLLEIGLHAKGGKLIVYCPDGFWRKGNIDVVCRKYNIKQVETFDELIKEINESKKRTQIK